MQKIRLLFKIQFEFNVKKLQTKKFFDYSIYGNTSSRHSVWN